MGEMQWRCRIRKGSVKPRLNVVPLHSKTRVFHDEARHELLAFAHEITSEDVLSGYAVMAMSVDGEMWTQMCIAEHCRLPRSAWPAVVADKLREVINAQTTVTVDEL